MYLFICKHSNVFSVEEWRIIGLFQYYGVIIGYFILCLSLQNQSIVIFTYNQGSIYYHGFQFSFMTRAKGKFSRPFWPKTPISRYHIKHLATPKPKHCSIHDIYHGPWSVWDLVFTGCQYIQIIIFYEDNNFSLFIFFNLKEYYVIFSSSHLNRLLSYL